VNPAPSSTETERLARDLLDRTRAEITQADNKAAILLAGVLAVAGGIVAAIGAGKWNPVHKPWYVAVPFWAATAAMVAAITCLAAAIYPRSRARTAQKLTAVGYFADVVALESTDQLRGLLSEPGAQFDFWIDQIWHTSAIVNRKYWLVRRAFGLLGVALVLAVVVVIAAMIRSH
jgi:hypothetical protein